MKDRRTQFWRDFDRAVLYASTDWIVILALVLLVVLVMPLPFVLTGPPTP